MLMGETYRLLPHRNRSSLTVGGCISATERHYCHGEGPKMATQSSACIVPGVDDEMVMRWRLPSWLQLLTQGRKGRMTGPKRAPKATSHSRLLLFINFFSASHVR